MRNKLCEYCGNEFMPHRKTNRFCSYACVKAAKGHYGGRYSAGLRCECCGRTFAATGKDVRRGRKYCSNECRYYAKGSVEKRGCAICGKKFSVPLSFPHKACSDECQAILRSQSISGEGNPAWRGGISDQGYPPEWGENLKEQIRSRANRLCALCQGQETDIKHSVHHIDGDKDNVCSANLIALCQSCHAKVHMSGLFNFWAGVLKADVMYRVAYI